jgi:hypothetical protein
VGGECRTTSASIVIFCRDHLLPISVVTCCGVHVGFSAFTVGCILVKKSWYVVWESLIYWSKYIKYLDQYRWI